MALSSHPWLPPDVKIEWQGFSGRAAVMQRYGWEFQEMRDVDRHFTGEQKIVMRHRAGGWCGYATCPERDLMRAFSACGRYATPEISPTFVVQRMAANADKMLIHAGPGVRHYPLDFQPRFHEEAIRHFTLAEIFKPEEPEEIIVEPATVMSLLEQIKQMQAPDLARIREENRKRDSREAMREVHHATILSFAA